MPGIPSTYRARETLPDGHIVHFRPIRSGDRHRLREEFLKLSTASVRDRFFSVKLDLTPKELSYFTEVDLSHHVALVAELESETGLRPAGVGRFVRTREQPGHCEAALTIVDDLHGLGIGFALLNQLIHCARELGISHLDASVMPLNTAMKRLLHKTGLPIDSKIEDGILTCSLKI